MHFSMEISQEVNKDIISNKLCSEIIEDIEQIHYKGIICYIFGQEYRLLMVYGLKQAGYALREKLLKALIEKK